MDVAAVTLLLALLAVVAQVAVAAAVLGWVAARVWPRTARRRRAVLDAVGPDALGLAVVVAAVATAGSLYLSEVAGFTPCRLCWYQRAAMYPLVPLLALAWWRRSLRVRPWALALTAAGAATSTFHLAVERFPSLEGGVACDPSNPCSLVWVRELGYLTIPGMALSGFALIAVLLLVATPPGRAGRPGTAGAPAEPRSTTDQPTTTRGATP